MDDQNTAYSEQDLQYAAEFRDGVHREALAKVRRVFPDAQTVIDRYPVEAYFQEVWDYPGQWYTVVAIPKASGTREALIDAIVRDTLAYHRRLATAPQTGGNRTPHTADAVRQPADAGVDPAGFRFPDDPFYERIAAYPDCVPDYCIVTGDPLGYHGCASHWRALAAACGKLFADGAADGGWNYDAGKARGKRIETEALFTSAYPRDGLNYRKAFLYPPHGNGYTGMDFVKVNAALFPNGTDGLEVFEWTTDWSAYFDEGHEWWGALCLTVYDKTLDRFVVILASATD